jgi:hypothetical protein
LLDGPCDDLCDSFRIAAAPQDKNETPSHDGHPFPVLAMANQTI